MFGFEMITIRQCDMFTCAHVLAIAAMATTKSSRNLIGLRHFDIAPLYSLWTSLSRRDGALLYVIWCCSETKRTPGSIHTQKVPIFLSIGTDLFVLTAIKCYNSDSGSIFCCLPSCAFFFCLFHKPFWECYLTQSCSQDLSLFFEKGIIRAIPSSPDILPIQNWG